MKKIFFLIGIAVFVFIISPCDKKNGDNGGKDGLSVILNDII